MGHYQSMRMQNITDYNKPKSTSSVAENKRTGHSLPQNRQDKSHDMKQKKAKKNLKRQRWETSVSKCKHELIYTIKRLLLYIYKLLEVGRELYKPQKES
jgi:hypothetical protein